ncbi:hypothetical protein HID58_009569 [Brassica napus]|uniref:Transcription repressor n=1 Tax=Brassica napus TaxID=3708 RepID=A0ABQ8DTN2_BRANA|nr:hypothetical protein HID58_009569 [Brassica napus]
MGNYKFKISDMIPNAWLHKLKDMTKQSKPKHKPSSCSSNTCNKKKPSSDSPLLHHSSTFRFSNSLVPNSPHRNSPRSSLYTKRKSKRKTLYKLSLKPITPPFASESSTQSLFPALESSPDNLIKKPIRCHLSVKIIKRKNMMNAEQRRDTKIKFPVEENLCVKRSADPKKDFRESMVEMIEENNIRASKDLEDLLACYLSLNPKEYHDLIIHVFEQIWRQFTKTK